MYQWFGLLAIGLVITVYGLILDAMPTNGNHSISQHVARHKPIFILTAVTFCVYGVLLYFFFAKWLVPELGLAGGFDALVVLSTLATIVTALIPDNEKVLYRKLHRIAAYGLAVISYGMTLWILLAPKAHTGVHVWAGVVGGYMTYCIVAYLFVTKLRAYYLVHQIGYILTFYSLLIAVSFLA